MYKLTAEKIGKYKIYCLSDEKLDFFLKFIPEKGATVSDLRLNRQNIYAGYDNFSDLESLKWCRGILLAPFPNRLNKGKFSFEGNDYQFPINDHDTGTALHGFVSQLKFEIGDLVFNPNNASVTCYTSYEGNLEYFPFPFTAKVTYSLDTNDGFSLNFSVTNNGKSNMPIGIGWHPYFCLSKNINKTILKLPKLEMIEINQSMIPIGKKTPFSIFENSLEINDFVLDNCFLLENDVEPATVVLDGEYGKLTYSQNTNIPYLQVFTHPDRKSIALEPMTCNVDAFNNGEGLKILAPNESIELECKVILEPKDLIKHN